VQESRRKGVNVIFKSFPNRPHDVPEGSVELAKAFLLYHHKRNIKDLSESQEEPEKEQLLYIGDDVDGVYYQPDSIETRLIANEDRVYLPSEEIARAWGEYRKSNWDKNVAVASKK
jgi:hypothetical protein